MNLTLIIHTGLTGLFYNLYFAFYQYVVPIGPVPAELDIGRIIITPMVKVP